MTNGATSPGELSREEPWVCLNGHKYCATLHETDSEAFDHCCNLPNTGLYGWRPVIESEVLSYLT